MFYRVFLIFFILNFASSKENIKKDEDIFVATNEWKLVPKGQKIPKGLHVRINFETGLTEAKLLDEHDKKSTNSLIAIDKDEEPLNLSIKDEKSLKEKLKPYKKPKHNLKKSNLLLKNETSSLYNLIFDGNLEPLDRIKGLLDRLDKPPDISNDFIKLEGFEKFLYPNLNVTNEDLLSHTLNFLGSLAQNNPTIKVYAVDTGSLVFLQRFLSEKSNDVRSKAVFALGSILRQFPFAQLKFKQNGGFVGLIDAMRGKEQSLRLKMKTIVLINDLVEEYKISFHKDRENRYEEIDTVDLFIQLGYCQELKDLMVSLSKFDGENYDDIEKCVVAMKEVDKECMFFADSNTLKLLFTISKQLQELKEDENYPQLMSIASDFINNSTKIKEEL